MWFNQTAVAVAALGAGLVIGMTPGQHAHLGSGPDRCAVEGRSTLTDCRELPVAAGRELRHAAGDRQQHGPAGDQADQPVRDHRADRLGHGQDGRSLRATAAGRRRVADPDPDDCVVTPQLTVSCQQHGLDPDHDEHRDRDDRGERHDRDDDHRDHDRDGDHRDHDDDHDHHESCDPDDAHVGEHRIHRVGQCDADAEWGGREPMHPFGDGAVGGSRR